MKLDGLRVAALAADRFEQSELTEPMRALQDEGAQVSVVSLKAGSIQGVKGGEPGDTIPVDRTLDDCRSADFDALLIPGGVKNPDIMRQDERAVRFVREFVDAGKPIAAICHAPWMLVEADAVRGRRLTSYPSLRTDIRNAGGEWVDEAVVVDRGIVTSRRPDDIPQFNAKMLEEFGEGVHERHPAGATTGTRAGSA
jgi:protease I